MGFNLAFKGLSSLSCYGKNIKTGCYKLRNEVRTRHLMLLDVKTEPIRACNTRGKGENRTQSFNGEF
jgi:hypothetical protein